MRPLLGLWREETEAYCARGRPRVPRGQLERDTKRGLIRDADPARCSRSSTRRARENLLALATADEPPRLPRTLERTLHELLASADGTKEADLGGGIRAVREYDRVSPRARPRPLRALDDRVRPAGARGACLAARATASRAVARSCRTSSSTRRCRVRERAALAARRRGGRGCLRARNRGDCRCGVGAR